MPKFISHPSRRIVKWILIIVLGISALLFLAGNILSGYVKRTVQRRLEAAGGKISDLDINIFTKRLAISEFELNVPDDINSVPTTGRIKKILLKNINIYQLLANKELRIGEVLIADGAVSVNRNIKPDTAATTEENGLKGISIERLVLEKIKVSMVSDSSKEFSGIIDATLNQIQSSDTADLKDLKAYSLKNIDIRITALEISAPKLYEIKIANIHATSDTDKLVIDSIMLVPKYTKFNFAQVAGKQTDRINTFIRQIEIDGLKYNRLRDSSLVASTMKIISGDVYSFRDKRQPFRETEVKPLPIAALKKINFGIEFDTIRIIDSKVTYEEFAPDGFDGGKITFENLTATLTNLSNRAYQNKPDHATLVASAKLMGQGLIEATFQLPFKDEPYYAEGKIGKMALNHLNPPLQKLAFIRIESGTLNNLNFKFNYTDRVSNGRLTINYENLKIEGLKKERSAVINDLKTLLINTVVKNNKDKSVPMEKRTGTIEFERDRKRQVFNYWWKSLFSGIKSSVLEN